MNIFILLSFIIFLFSIHILNFQVQIQVMHYNILLQSAKNQTR